MTTKRQLMLICLGLLIDTARGRMMIRGSNNPRRQQQALDNTVVSNFNSGCNSPGCRQQQRLPNHLLDNEEDNIDILSSPNYYLDASRRTQTGACLAGGPARVDVSVNNIEPELTVIQYYFAIESSKVVHRTDIRQLEDFLFNIINTQVMWCSFELDWGGDRARHLSDSMVATVQSLQDDSQAGVKRRERALEQARRLDILMINSAPNDLKTKLTCNYDDPSPQDNYCAVYMGQMAILALQTDSLDTVVDEILVSVKDTMDNGLMDYAIPEVSRIKWLGAAVNDMILDEGPDEVEDNDNGDGDGEVGQQGSPHWQDIPDQEDSGSANGGGDANEDVGNTGQDDQPGSETSAANTDDSNQDSDGSDGRDPVSEPTDDEGNEVSDEPVQGGEGSDSGLGGSNQDSDGSDGQDPDDEPTGVDENDPTDEADQGGEEADSGSGTNQDSVGSDGQDPDDEPTNVEENAPIEEPNQDQEGDDSGSGSNQEGVGIDGQDPDDEPTNVEETDEPNQGGEGEGSGSESDQSEGEISNQGSTGVDDGEDDGRGGGFTMTDPDDWGGLFEDNNNQFGNHGGNQETGDQNQPGENQDGLPSGVDQEAGSDQNQSGENQGEEDNQDNSQAGGEEVDDSEIVSQGDNDQDPQGDQDDQDQNAGDLNNQDNSQAGGEEVDDSEVVSQGGNDQDPQGDQDGDDQDQNASDSNNQDNSQSGGEEVDDSEVVGQDPQGGQDGADQDVGSESEVEGPTDAITGSGNQVSGSGQISESEGGDSDAGQQGQDADDSPVGGQEANGEDGSNNIDEQENTNNGQTDGSREDNNDNEEIEAQNDNSGIGIDDLDSPPRSDPSFDDGDLSSRSFSEDSSGGVLFAVSLVPIAFTIGVAVLLFRGGKDRGAQGYFGAEEGAYIVGTGDPPGSYHDGHYHYTEEGKRYLSTHCDNCRETKRHGFFTAPELSIIQEGSGSFGPSTDVSPRSSVTPYEDHMACVPSLTLSSSLEPDDPGSVEVSPTHDDSQSYYDLMAKTYGTASPSKRNTPQKSNLSNMMFQPASRQSSPSGSPIGKFALTIGDDDDEDDELQIFEETTDLSPSAGSATLSYHSSLLSKSRSGSSADDQNDDLLGDYEMDQMVDVEEMKEVMKLSSPKQAALSILPSCSSEGSSTYSDDDPRSPKFSLLGVYSASNLEKGANIDYQIQELREYKEHEALDIKSQKYEANKSKFAALGSPNSNQSSSHETKMDFEDIL